MEMFYMMLIGDYQSEYPILILFMKELIKGYYLICIIKFTILMGLTLSMVFSINY